MTEPEPGSWTLDDRLDALVARFADALAAGRRPSPAEYLQQVPPQARPGLERVLKMILSGTAPSPGALHPLGPGVQLGQYRLEHELGRGGMAHVWLARDLELRRPVALKILRPGLAMDGRHVDRFRREALAIARLSHPHIVQIHGVGESGGHHWLAMAYVEGPSLATVLEALPDDRPRTAEDLARAARIPGLAAPGRSYEQALALLLAPVAEALARAHEHGLVHRDVKPSNILLHADGRAVIADFGLAKSDNDPALSLTGEGLGTPYYMSPEQARVTGGPIDHRTDVYSFGVTLYEALSGRRPFRGESFLEVVDAIRNTVPPSLRAVAPERSRDAAAVVRRAMARQPERRYGSGAALHRDLLVLAEGRPTEARQAEGRPTEARQAEGGWLRRAGAQLRLASSGQPFEYRSARTFLGLPLVHWISGPRPAGIRRRVAKGWLARGDVAVGGVALGGVAAGGIACGGVVLGVLGWGGLAAGAAVWGGIAAGGLVFAGIGLGWLAIGGIALGRIAIGGIARGRYAAGGDADGTHILSDRYRDPEAEQLFERMFDSWEGFWSSILGA